MITTGEMTGPIAIYGASGYTGRLVAEELAHAGVEFVVAGRNRDKLEAAAVAVSGIVPRNSSSGDAMGMPRIEVVGIENASGLRELFSGCSAVIACAGPFSLHGEPVLAAAVDSGTHYLDTTGEQPFMLTAFEGYGRRAEKAGIVVLPAMGYDYVPADLLVALTARDVTDPIDRIRIAYHSPFQPSRGTVRSSLEMVKGGDVEWRDGTLRTAPQKVSRPDFDFGPPLGPKKMMRFPGGEHVTVPRHLGVRSIETSMTSESILPSWIAGLMPLLARPTGLVMRTPARAAVSRLVSLMPEGARPEDRDSTRFAIGCEITSTGGTRRGLMTGTDVYGLTAALIVKGALAAARGEIVPSGALAPAEAFDPEEFLAGMDRFELEWTVDRDAD
ncbi:MAG: saccharopine dehydrogenase NADP-binding domain-containing protein [Actinomycetota bacterium]|nr:saccharopine dehydrogenase NADP-binding domain-containing protein [Actinomycetota bacterium]